jgi:hypothetical protein
MLLLFFNFIFICIFIFIFDFDLPVGRQVSISLILSKKLKVCQCVIMLKYGVEILQLFLGVLGFGHQQVGGFFEAFLIAVGADSQGFLALFQRQFSEL